MSAELERRALELYARALELAEDGREAFLRASADSAELLELVLRMLRVESPSAQLARSSQGISLVAALHLEGRQLGDFRLLREIGGGAVGRVFEAEQLALKRRVAVKVLRLEHCENPEMLRRFHQEPELQARLRHPNIVGVLATGIVDGWHYFAMEHVPGTSLAKLLEERLAPRRADAPPPPLDLDSSRACAELIEKVARALHFAHENGLVHRDVKPHNVLVDPSGEPFVSDFGLAKALDRTALTASMGDGLRGTLAYMSPEQATEFHAADARADVYSLGAVLYQMLTRCLPFEAESGVQLLNKIVSPSSHVRPPHHFVPGFDPRLSWICTTALEKDPGRRFATALEMAERLRAFREGRPVGARPVSRFRQIGERRIGRRAVLQGAAVSASILGGAALAGSRWVLAAPPARLALELAPGLEAVRVRLVPLLPPEGRLGAPIDLGRVARGEPVRGIEPGSYRVVVEDGSGAFAELQRSFASEGRVLARASPTRPGSEGGSMVLVPGGSGRVDVPKLGVIDFRCEAFWIDRAPVTNRAYRAFLETTGRWPSDEWSPEWIDLWNGVGPVPRPEYWDDLPVVRVSWARAREYAEWQGKRLPTAAEWSLALGLEATPKVPAETWQRLADRFTFGEPTWLPNAEGAPSTGLAYLAHARPVRADAEAAFGSHGIAHPFGSVAHWLEPGQFVRDDAGAWASSGLRYEAQGAWHFSPLEGHEGIIGLRVEADSAADLGFRCAKSAKP
jgi:formylglycine-generating enzyme required for sulfatase activity/tRNA A-37 threonylcarbamoyl transferase component Bud32